MSIKDFAHGKETAKWFPLKNEPKKKEEKSGAEVHLKLVWLGEPEGGEKPKKEDKLEATSSKTETEAPKVAERGTFKIEDKYELGKVLGRYAIHSKFYNNQRGAFSVVKMGIRKNNGKKYAVKCISKKLIDKKEMALLEREIDIMKKLQHPHIIQLWEVIDSPETLFLVLEL